MCKSPHLIRDNRGSRVLFDVSKELAQKLKGPMAKTMRNYKKSFRICVRSQHITHKPSMYESMNITYIEWELSPGFGHLSTIPTRVLFTPFPRGGNLAPLLMSAFTDAISNPTELQTDLSI